MPIEIWATDGHRLDLKPVQRRVWAPIGQRPISLGHQRYEWHYDAAFVQPTSGETVWHLSNGISIPFFEKPLDRTEDVVQEACLRALRGLDRYSGGNARAWLLAITRNTAFTWMARNRPKALVVTEDIEALAPADGAPTPEESLIEKVDAAAIERAIGALPPPFKETLVLRDLMD